MAIIILQWNFRSFRTQHPNIHTAIDKFQPHILSLQETNLKPYQSHLRSYHPLRSDRTDRQSGGVALFIHNKVPYLSIPISLPIPLEAVAARLFFENQQFTLCSLYLPPDLDNDCFKQALTSLINLLPPPVVFTTDANAHHLHMGITCI